MANNGGFDYNRIAQGTQPNPTFIIPQQQSAPFNCEPNSMVTVCPSCRAHIQTKVSHNATSTTHLTALCLCLFS